MKTQRVLPWRGGKVWSIACACTLLPFVAYAQRAPSVPDRPWESGRAEDGLHAGPGNEMKLDPAHIYIENARGTDLVFLETLASKEFSDVSLNQSLRCVPSEMLKAPLNLDKETAMKIPVEKLVVI